MLVALTGTPGTGKSSIAPLLEGRGYDIIDLFQLARDSNAMGSYDARADSWEVDLALLEGALPRRRSLIIVGHLSHRLSVDMAIVLRCHPEVLRERLLARGWRVAKVRENVEAEAIGVITAELIDRDSSFEVDTTHASPEETVEALLTILAGKGDKYRAGWVDWSEVILGWY